MRTEEKFWDRIAQYLDWIEKRDEPTNAALVAATRTRLTISDHVLDCGCGTGTAAIALAGSVATILGIDISSKMIDTARRKTVERQVTNLSFAHATIFDDALAPGSFDAILCFYLLHLVDNPASVVQRMNELLKPGGLLVSATPCLRGTLWETLLWPVSKLGLVPRITSFRISELESLMTTGHFAIVDTHCVHASGQQFFVVARKI